MNNVNENKNVNVKLTKHFIKDLSFENLQNIYQNYDYNNNVKINDKLNVNFNQFENNFFSLTLKYNFHCSSKEDNKNLCHLELDYIGLFKILNKSANDQKTLTQNGLKLLFPFANKILEYITQSGGSIPISLKNIDLTLNEN
tara:strand:- start:1088 stop:1513 length:426 start_codon:yes stop_codon:yes gene_type:complete